MAIQKIKKWLKVMQVDFMETVHWNLLKLLEHVTIIHVHLPLKWIDKWMHGFQFMERTNFCSMYFNFCIL